MSARYRSVMRSEFYSISVSDVDGALMRAKDGCERPDKMRLDTSDVVGTLGEDPQGV